MIGQTISHYRILAKIGAGGMGEVYRAHDEQLDRDVALKLLPAQTSTDDAARARLLREARAAAALNHPHICTIHEVGEADDQAYIAMELVEGRPLSVLIPAEGLAVETALRYGAQVADALATPQEIGFNRSRRCKVSLRRTPWWSHAACVFGWQPRLGVRDLRTDA